MVTIPAYPQVRRFGLFSQTDAEGAHSRDTAFNNLSKHLSLVLATDGVLVTTVSPGIFDTSSWQDYIEEKASAEGTPPDAMRAREDGRAVAQIPLRRLGGPEEVAGLIAFLASEQASYLTGSNLIVDGGKSRGV